MPVCRPPRSGTRVRAALARGAVVASILGGAAPAPNAAMPGTTTVAATCSVTTAPPEVSGARFLVDRETLVWSTAAGATTYDVYEGRVGRGRPFVYAHTCLRLGVTASSVTDAVDPGAGELFYYLVAARNCFGVGSLGTTPDSFSVPGPDNCPDRDADGVSDLIDSCPSVPNGAQPDADGDGIGDACDRCPGLGPDPDGDNVCDPDDNCPAVPNADQADRNSDGTGDACDPTLPFVTVQAAHAFGAWLVGTVPAGSGAVQASRWRVSNADGTDFDRGVIYDQTVTLRPFTENRVLYDHAVASGPLYARVRFQVQNAWGQESASTAFAAVPLPVDAGTGAHVGHVELEDTFDGPLLSSTARADNLDRGGRLWPASLNEASPLKGQYFTLAKAAAAAAPTDSGPRAQPSVPTSLANSFVIARIVPSTSSPNYDFSFGLRSSGTGTAHCSYRCKVERVTTRDTIKFNKYCAGSRGMAVATWSGDLGAPPWLIRCETITEGTAVRLYAYAWSGATWVLKSSFLDNGSSGVSTWDAIPRILVPGRVTISHEKTGQSRYEAIVAGSIY
jgi:hypothetical protein